MHTHVLLFGSKFHIILAMYVQMLDIYIENIGYFRYFWYFRKYNDIFQPWAVDHDCKAINSKLTINNDDNA